MSRMQRWVLIGLAVALAAFLTGVLRGVTGTVPPGMVPTTPAEP